MKLYYEIKKILSQKSFWLITSLFLIANIGLIIFQIQTSEEIKISHHTQYLDLMNTLDSFEYEEKIDYLQHKINDNDLIIEIDNYIENGGLLNDLSLEKQEIYSAQNVNKTISAISKSKLLQSTLKEIENNHSYSNYITSVKEGILYLKDSPVWNSYSASKQESFKQMYDTYDKLSDVEIVENRILTLDVIGSNKTIDLLMIIFISLVITFVYQSDEDTKMSDIISSSKVGYRYISILKLLTIIIIVSSVALLIYLSFILLSSYQYGFAKLGSSIQSYNYFSTSPYALSVMEYYLFLVLYKLASYMIIILIGTILYRLFKVREVGIGLFFSLLIFSSLLYSNIKADSAMFILKYVNLFSIPQFSEMIRIFTFIEVAGISGLWLNLAIVIIIISTVVFVFVHYIVISKIESNRKPNNNRYFSLPKPIKSISLFWHETYKLIFMDKSYLILIVGLVLIANINLTINDRQIYGAERATIELIKQYGGEKTELTTNFIIENAERFKNEKEKMDTAIIKFSNNEIIESEYYEILTAYQEKFIDRVAFERFVDLYNNSDKFLIFTSPFDILFSQYSATNEINIAFICIIVIILLVTNIYVIDQKDNENNLYIATLKGNSNRRNEKIKAALLVITILFIVSFTLQFYLVMNKYDLNGLSYPMASVLDLEVNSAGFIAYPWIQTLSITNYLLLINFIRIIGLVFITMGCILISKLSKTRISAILIATVIFLVPSFLHLIGFGFAKYFSVFDIISGNIFVRHVYYYPKLIIIMVITILVYIYLVRITKD